jgi:hypothetical protein
MEKPVAKIVGGGRGIGADSARKLEAFEPDPDSPTACQRNPIAWLEDLLDVTKKVRELSEMVAF